MAELGLVEWLEAGDAFDELFHPSPTDRPGREGVARNAAIALSGVPSDRGRGALLKALSFDPSQVVREAAAWSLAKAHAKDDGVRGALERAAAAEHDAGVRAAILAWRDRCT